MTAARPCLRLTRHARDVCARRSVSLDEIVDAITDPQITEPHDGRTRYVRNGLAVVAVREADAIVVVTVLLRERRTWTDADARARRVAAA